MGAFLTGVDMNLSSGLPATRLFNTKLIFHSDSHVPWAFEWTLWLLSNSGAFFNSFVVRWFFSALNLNYDLTCCDSSGRLQWHRLKQLIRWKERQLSR